MNVYQLALFTLPIELGTGEILRPGIANVILKEETVHYYCGLGVQGCHEDNLHISIKVLSERYDDAVRWLSAFVYGVQFDQARFAITT